MNVVASDVYSVSVSRCQSRNRQVGRCASHPHIGVQIHYEIRAYWFQTETADRYSGSSGSWCRRRGGADHMNSVLSALSCRWFDLVQRATDSTHSPISWQSDANWCGRQLPWICVSSANWWTLRPVRSTILITSAVYIRQRIGPNTALPMGTPNFVSEMAESSMWTET